MKRLYYLLFLIVLFISYSCKKDNISDFIDSSQIKYNYTDYAVNVFNITIPTHQFDFSGFKIPSDLHSKVRALSSTYPI